MACYLGREALVKNDMSRVRVSRRTVVHQTNPDGTPLANAKKTFVHFVNIDKDYLQNEEEIESYRVLHQLEFNSFREQALLAAKLNSKSSEL